MRALPGRPAPLGAIWDGQGTNFAVFSEHAKRVDLCLFSRPEDGVESARIPLSHRTGGVWHTHLAAARPGLLYGYRAEGPFAPEQGHRFNPSKLLIDPYAKALTHMIMPTDEVYGYRLGDRRGDLARDTRNSAAGMAKCVVIDDAFEWGDDRPPRTPWNETVIYECHVKGMTIRHPEVPSEMRGRYLGLAAQPIIDHFLSLGVTAVELLPVHQCVSERRLVDRGLTNYWGYNSIAFFAPDVRFASGGLGEQVVEFKTMVKRLHAAGIEVILDVVYNHTAEGNEMGPTLSLRGLDNTVYYRLDPANPRHHIDVTGCGNTVNVPNPRALDLVLDSLRYWVREMRVDGFRFDLAPALAREPFKVNRHARFFEMLRSDPLLSQVKLIAEPWDAAPDGYLLGGFPDGWSEWNARYRDTVRRFWRGESGLMADLAFRMTGSSDLFGGPRGREGRGPSASVNYVACHDGCTLEDLVTYERKYNEANGEENRDGPADDYGRNWGVEGPTDRAPVVHRRERAKKNLLAMLAFSQGVPMIGQGDEMGRTQHGNNNAYCQDGEISWMDWDVSARQRAFLEFARRVFAVRRANPLLRRRAFFHGDPITHGGVKDLTWIRADGGEMTGHDWADATLLAIGMLMHGDASHGDPRHPGGRRDTLLWLLNGSDGAAQMTLPRMAEPGPWREIVNTARDESDDVTAASLVVEPYSLVLLAHRGSL